MALQAIVQADDRRFYAAVLARERDDGVLGKPGNLRPQRRGIFLHPRFQLLETQRVFADIVVVEQILIDQHVHHGERERTIAAGQGL